MAKKKNENPLGENTSAGSFSKLNDFLNTIAPDGEMLDINPIAKIDEWIPTGWYILNAALSGSLFGGMPNRRSFAIAGDEGTGKTFIALSICRMSQPLDYYVIYCDSEGSIDTEFVRRLGLDSKRIRLQPMNTVEEFNHFAAQINIKYKEMRAKGEVPPKIIIVLDSLGNLSSTKEVTDSTEGSEKRDMTKQQQIRKMFRVNGLNFAMNAIPFIITNHTYDAVTGYSPKEISGGGGLKYNASIIFMLGKGKLDDSEGEKIAKQKNVEPTKVGITIFVSPFKQRFARTIKVQIHIPFFKKPNPFVGLEKFVSWESVGIIRGKCITEKEFNKLNTNEQATCKVFTKSDGTKAYAFPKDTARTLVCKHLDGEVPLSELFTERVFTQDILHELDEKVIKPTFCLPDINSLEDLEEITKELELEAEEDEGYNEAES